MDVRYRKPLWGFGPIGWTASAVLAAMLIALARGWDPVYTASWLIWQCGPRDMGGWLRVWAYVWWGPAMVNMSVTYGVIGLLYTIVAVFVYPRRVPRAALAALVAVVLVEAFGWAGFPKNWQSYIPIEASHLFPIVASVLEMGLLFWITRRWWCSLPLLVPLYYHGAQIGRGWAWFDSTWLVVGFHVSLMGLLMAWAVSARLKPAPKVRPCPGCEYDLTGLNRDTCPECGRPILTAN